MVRVLAVLLFVTNIFSQEGGIFDSPTAQDTIGLNSTIPSAAPVAVVEGFKVVAREQKRPGAKTRFSKMRLGPTDAASQQQLDLLANRQHRSGQLDNPTFCHGVGNIFRLTRPIPINGGYMNDRATTRIPYFWNSILARKGRAFKISIQGFLPEIFLYFGHVPRPRPANIVE